MKTVLARIPFYLSRPLYCCVLFLSLSIYCFPQKVAVVELGTPKSAEFADVFSQELGKKVSLLDTDLSRSAFSASKHADPFNMTTDESKQAGSAIGCDVFILIRTETQRRTSTERPEYYEAYATVNVVDSRTGRLIFQTIPTTESIDPLAASGKLADLAISAVSDVLSAIAELRGQKTAQQAAITMEELPVENSAAAKDFRAPIPYRRIKPEYTQPAYLYGITATVEIVVDLDAGGGIMRTEIFRWAGFGLDVSVEKAVRAMSWRPAERNGKTLPMRVLLRYNFKQTDTKP